MFARLRFGWLPACIVLLALSRAVCAEEGPRWEPQKTWVFIAGLVEWKDETAETFEKKGRQDTELAAAFKARGVPAEQVVTLIDRKATRKACIEGLTKLLAKTKAGDSLVFYYTGHGGWDPDDSAGLCDFEAYDRSWSVEAALRLIERKFQGSHVLLLVDCCCSGGIIDKVQNRKSKLSYGCLASVYKNNTSTENWTFTGCLVKGLRGEPEVDLDEDGAIDLEELARYSMLEMAFVENQKAVFHVTNQFHRHLQLGPAKAKTNPEIGRRIEAQRGKKWKRAKIEAITKDKYKVRYVPDNEVEWLTPKQIRPYRPKRFAEGSLVEVLDEEGFEKYCCKPATKGSEGQAADKEAEVFEPRWFGAKVIESWYGLHHIRYEDTKMKWDEWVAPGRIKAKQ